MQWIINNESNSDYSLTINEIIKELNISDEHILSISFDENTLNKISQKSLFNDYKLIIIKEVDFISSKEKVKKQQELIDYILKDNVNYILITNKKPLLELNENFKILNIEQLNNKNKEKYINNLLLEKKLVLSEKIIDSLKNKLPDNFLIIRNEINKLALLLITNNNEDDLINSIANYNDENIFNLLNFIFDSDINNVLKIYENLKQKKQDEFQIIATLAYQINQILFIKKMLMSGKSSKMIQEILHIQPFVFNNIKRLCDKNDLAKIMKFVDNLFNLELDIKSMKIDKVIGFKNFLLNHII